MRGRKSTDLGHSNGQTARLRLIAWLDERSTSTGLLAQGEVSITLPGLRTERSGWSPPPSPDGDATTLAQGSTLLS